MGRLTKEQRLAKVHADAMAEFDRIQSALADERRQCLEDRRFYSLAGAQWEGALGEQFENKPKLEVNKIHLAVIRIISERRNNRITVNFLPKHGEDDGDLADTCNGLFRADEQDSVADEAYDNAFEEAVGGGFGAWRLRAVDADPGDPESDEQRIRIEPIYDADTSVYFDLDAKRYDKADARCCFVITSMTPEAYRAEYNDSPASWPKGTTSVSAWEWARADVVYVAEYYLMEEERQTIHVFRTLTGEEERHTDEDLEADDGALMKDLEATGARELRRKVVKTRRPHKYILSGGGVLEDEGFVAGEHIPVIPCYGKRWFIDNIERCMGHVRLAKDPQRLKNMQVSKLAEISALSAVEKPILTPEQIAGHQLMWSEDNLKQYPYLLLNPVIGIDGNPMPAGPVAYTKPPSIPPAMAALLQLTEQDMRDILGNQEQGDKMVANIAQKTVEQIHERLDMQTFIYVDNLAKSIRRHGEVWLSMARAIYVEEGRKMKGLSPDGKPRTITLVEPIIADDGALAKANNLDDADFDVAVEVGPSSASKRAAIVRGVTGLLQYVPQEDAETRSLLMAFALMNMDGEGLGPLRDFFRQKMLRAGVVKPEPEEAEQLQAEQQNARPDPQSEYLQSAAEAEKAKAAAARAATMKTVAQAKLAHAQTAKTRAETAASLTSRPVR